MEKIEQKIAKLETELEKLKKEYKEQKENPKTGRWQPSNDELYYAINTEGGFFRSEWKEHFLDKNRFSIGNCFKTREEVESNIEKLKVIAELKAFAEPKDRAWDGNNKHYYFYLYADSTSKLTIDYARFFMNSTIYFKTAEMAKKAIEAVGEERIKKYYLGVE